MESIERRIRLEQEIQRNEKQRNQGHRKEAKPGKKKEGRIKNVKTAKKEIRIFLTRLLVLAATCWILFGVIFGITPMKNNDMFPKISAGDVLFYYRLEKDLVSGDVVVFEKEGKQYTGRIVARGGESVAVTEEEELEINGSIVIENDIFYETPQYKSDVTYPVELKSDEYFILEDQREGAKDSRSFGAVKKEEIKGKVITVLRRSNL